MRARSALRIFGTALVISEVAACTTVYWGTYRNDIYRGGNQPVPTVLSDPKQVPGLAIRATFSTPSGEVAPFYASPIVVGNRVFIGALNGRFYALDAGTLRMIWQFPPVGQPPLLGTCAGDPANPTTSQSWGRYGIQSSASYYKPSGLFKAGMVIFGANDPTAESGLGSSRLFALNATDGTLIWKSDVVAHLDGCTGASTTEHHERIAFSAPLVSGSAVYIGVHDSGDDPTQRGRVMAVSVDSGLLLPGFEFAATSPTAHGAGIWNSLATDPAGGIYFTTGNIRCDGINCFPEPPVDYGISMMRIDPKTGGVTWQFRAVPFDLDDDDDWAAGVAIDKTSSCGTLATSVQKDGFTYAIDTTSGSCAWHFPPAAPVGCRFPPGGPRDHGDNDYKRPPAIWGDVLIVTAAGESLVQDGAAAGYGRLHALNACAPDELHRVRWLVDVPNATLGANGGYALGAPTVTGGIVYVMTDQLHVVALADPSVAPPSGYRCSNVDFTVAQCVQAGFAIVPVPGVLANVALPSEAGAPAAGMRNEPVLANGKVYVGTPGGHVYMLSP